MISLPEPLASLDIQPPMAEDYQFQRGVLTNDGVWFPLLPEKGYQVFNDYHRVILSTGPRKCGKTLTCANRMMRHLWEVDGAVAAVIARTMKNGKQGAWGDLTKFVLPGWVNSGMGLKILKQGTDATTKMEFIEISNVHGGTSRVELHSIDHEPDVERKYMATRFSMIWFSQGEQFEHVDTFKIMLMQLRVIGVSRQNHHFLLDMNPPEDGDLHWAHDLFYKARDEKSKYYNPKFDEQYSVHEFTLDDNPFLPDEDKEELKDIYKHDPVKYARFVNGQWMRDSCAGIFDSVFLPNIHIIGNSSSDDESEWTTLVPPRSAYALITGSDFGDVNHATSFISARINEDDVTIYDVFDEVCSIKQKVSIADFAGQVWDRVKFWSQWMQDEYDLKHPPQWRHWVDSAVFNYSAQANQNDAQIFWDATDGEIVLRPVKKGAGSKVQRIAMAKRLFFEKRIFISSHCNWNVRWARFLKPGNAKNEPIKAGQNERHCFDATTYGIGAEIPREMEFDAAPSTATGIITIGG